MKYQLKRIDTWSAVKITFVIAGAVGFVVGALYAVLITLMASLVGMFGMSEGMPDEMGYVVSATGFIAVVVWIVITMMYAVLGSLVVALSSWLYNLAAGVIGGVNLTLEAQPDATPVAAAVSTTTGVDSARTSDDADPASTDSGSRDLQST